MADEGRVSNPTARSFFAGFISGILKSCLRPSEIFWVAKLSPSPLSRKGDQGGFIFQNCNFRLKFRFLVYFWTASLSRRSLILREGENENFYRPQATDRLDFLDSRLRGNDRIMIFPRLSLSGSTRQSRNLKNKYSPFLNLDYFLNSG